MRRPSTMLLLLGVALAGLVLAAVCLHVPGIPDHARVVRQNAIIAVMMVAAAVYFVAVRMVLRHAFGRATLWGIIGIAILLRAILLPIPPFLSDDLYRYVWDGRVQAAGINPYRYIPADPALTALRDQDVYPHINRRDYARTIYPPAAQLVFAAVGEVWDSVTAMKLVMVGFEALGVVCLLQLLRLAGLPRERVLIYAWNPLALWSAASDGHVDAFVVGLLGLALLLRARQRDGWAGTVLACATLVKFFPIVVAAAFVRGGRLWRPALAGVATIVALYAVYSSAGSHVLGFLPSYESEEGLADGSGFWLLSGLGAVVALPAWGVTLYLAIAAAAIAGLSLFVLYRRQRVGSNDVTILCRDTAMLAAAATVAVSPHYAWYFSWLTVPAVVAPSRPVLWLSVVPLILYIDPWPHEHFLWRGLIYLPAAALLAIDLVRRRVLTPDSTSTTVCSSQT